MKHLLYRVERFIISIVAGTILLLSLHHSVYAEGTKQVRPDSTVSAAALIIDWDDPNFTRFCMLGCAANYRLNIHIKNIGEKILFGLKTPYNSPTPILYNLRRPDGTIAINGTLGMSGSGYIKYYRQATIGPFPTSGGYTPISVTSNMVGDWYFEITQVGNDALLNDNCARFDLWDFQVVNGVATPQPSDTLNGRVWSQSWQLYSRLPVNWPPNEVFSGSFYVYTDDGIVTKLVCNGMYMGEGTIFCNPVGCTNTGNFPIDRQSKNTNTFVGFPGIAGYKVFLNNPDITVYPNGVFGILNSVTYHDDQNEPCSWNKFFEINVNKGGQVVIKIDVPYGNPSYDVFIIANVVPGNNTIPWNGLDGHGGLVPNGTVLTISVDYLNGLTNLPLWDFEANPNGYKVYPVRPVGPGLLAPLFYWDDSQLTGTSNCSNPPTTVNLTGCNPSGSVCHDWPTEICHDKMINTWWYSGGTSSSLAITFNSQPIPVITGPAPVCTNTTGCLYTTETGNASYSWAVSAGGTITGGGGINNNSVTVTWGTAGARTVSVSYTGTNGCPSLVTTKNVLVSGSLTVSVSITASSNPVCPGTSVTFTATPTNGGTAPSYQWKVNGVIQGTNSPTFSYTPVNSDKITCVLTSNLTCATGPATSNTITMVVNNPLPVSVSIAASATTVCAGDPVKFTATPANGGPSPSYEWKVNGVNSGTNSSIFIFYPSDNDQISCILTSNLWCVTGPATSNTITINVNTRPIPTLTGPTPKCAGSTGNVYTTETNKSNYIWAVSAGGSITAGGTTSSSSVTVTWTTPGPQTVSVNYMNGSGCYAITPTVLNVTVDPRPVPTITGPASACTGSTGNIYTTEAGMSNYTWVVSGGGTKTAGGGINNNSITITWTTAGAQTIRVSYTNTFGCTTATPTIYNVTISNFLPVSVSIAASSNPVCAETSVTYTATPINGGSAPAYQWKVNGVNQGTNSPTYSYTPINGNIVSCVLTSNLSCANGNPATSNTITMTINPLLPVSVSIAASANPVCAGTAVTFTATPTNGGSAPSYQWKVNGVNQGTNSPTYTFTPINNQIIACVLTSNATCATGNPATSNMQTMTVNPMLPVSVSIAASANPVCAGTVVTFTASPTNGGSAPSYQWKVNGINQGTNSPIYTLTPINGQTITCVLISNASCTTGNPANSNSISITVNPIPVPTIIGPTPVCVNSTGHVYTTEVGMTNYLWSVSAGGTITAGGGTTNNTITVTWTTAGANTVSVNYTNSNGCTSASPTVFNVTVNSQPSISIQPSNVTVSVGSNTSFSVTATGIGLTYQWQVNTGSGWNNVFVGGIYSGVTTATLTLTGVTAIMNGYQYRCVLTGTCSPPATSNTATLTVQNLVDPGIIGTNQTICEGSTPLPLTGTVATGDPILTYQWQSSNNGTTFTDIVGATGQNYSPGALVADTWFRRTAISTVNGVSTSAQSNVVIITVNNFTAAGTIASNELLCIGETATPFTSIVPATGDGSITYQWQSSITSNSTGFSIIPGATGVTYAPPTPPVTTWYRRNAISILIADTCVVSSNVLEITRVIFNPGTITPYANDTIFCSGENPGPITGTLPTIIPPILFMGYQWQNSISGNPATFTDISLETGQNYDPPALTQSMWYRRIANVTITVNGNTKNCSEATNIVALRVYPKPTLTVSSPVITCEFSPYNIQATASNTGGNTPTYTLTYISGTYITPPATQTNTTGLFTVNLPTPPEAPPVGQQHFMVSVTNGDPGTCADSKPVVIEIYDVPNITLTASCAVLGGGGTITMTGVVTYPMGAVVEYSINGGVSWQTNPVFTNLPIGNYTVIARNSLNHSCTISLTGQILSIMVQTTDYAICEGGVVPPGQGLMGFSYCFTWGGANSNTGQVCTNASNTYFRSASLLPPYTQGPLVQWANYAIFRAPLGHMTFKDCPSINGSYSIYQYPFIPSTPAVNFFKWIPISCPGGPGNVVTGLDPNQDYVLVLNSSSASQSVCTNISFTTADQVQVVTATGAVKWYLNISDPNPIFTGSLFNPYGTQYLPTNSCPGDYIFYAGCATGTCREPAHFTIKPIPIIIATGDTICSGSATNIVLISKDNCNNPVNPANVTYEWTASVINGGSATGYSNCSTACGSVISQVITSTNNAICPIVRYMVRATVGGCSGNWYPVDVLIINIGSITLPVPPANVTYTCMNQVPPPGILSATHACLGILTATGVDSNNGGSGCPSSPLIITRTWTFVDPCGSFAVSQIIRVNDSIPPTFTRPPDITLYTDAACNYSANTFYTGDVTDETDNCSTGIQATYVDGVANGSCPGNKIITRTWSLVDNCGNAAPNQVQTITVLDLIPPAFTSLPTPVHTFCVIDIITANFYPDTMDITPVRPDYYILSDADKTSLNLNPATFWDNCTPAANLTLHWRIDFNGGIPAPITGTGQISAYPGVILFPGAPIVEVTHSITYWLEDGCQNLGNEAVVSIIIKPRPHVIKLN
jgi:PKD-like domain/PKD domain